MQWLSWIAVGLALATCHCESGPAPARKSALPAVAVAEVPPGAQVDASASLRRHMQAHFAEITALQSAVVQGRLTDAREQARWFASHEMDAPPDWRPYVDEMRFAAARIVNARDVAGAGAEIGRLGRACSACHEAQNARPAFAPVPVPPEGTALAAQMARHAWAAARLWEGLVGPADEQWQQGANMLAATPLDVAQSAHAKPNAEVAGLAEQLRDQANHAVTLTDHDARAAFYGDMMKTCASCHSIVRPTPMTGGR